MAPLAPYRTKAELVYAQLREQILSGGLAPGQRITLAGLAKQLQVSVMPIREAIARLEQEGLITLAPHKDTHVTDLSVRDVTQLFDIRGALEALAARLAAQNDAASCAERLVEAERRMRAAYERRDFHSISCSQMRKPVTRVTSEHSITRLRAAPTRAGPGK